MDTVLEYYTCVYTAVGFGMLRSTQPLEFVFYYHNRKDWPWLTKRI